MSKSSAKPALVAQTSSLWLFLAVTFVWTWTIELVGRARLDAPPTLEQLGPILIVASFGPTVGALVSVVREHGGSGPKQLLARLAPIRGFWRSWLMAAYCFVPAAILMLVVFAGGKLSRGLSEGALLAFVPIIGLFSIVGGPLGEELGWRGVLLPALLQRFSPLKAAVLVGVVWSIWHAPLWTFSDFITGVPAIAFVPLYVVSIVAFSTVLTVLHLRSFGSVALAMFAHGVFNSILLPFDALREDNVLTVASAWPFTMAIVVTSGVVVFLNRSILSGREPS